MTKYILLLRGINVGGKNKVPMSKLKEQLTEIGFTQVLTYINSGNLLINSDKSHAHSVQLITKLFKEEYHFPLPFILISIEDYIAIEEDLPLWWSDSSHYRRNVLFYLPQDKNELVMDTAKLTENEAIFMNDVAIFWVIKSDDSYSRNLYSKFASHPLYKQVTIRNANTFNKLLDLAKEYRNT